MIKKLHVFNPETDMALASGSPYYTPPKAIVNIRQQMSLFPATYSRPGDGILLLDDLQYERIQNKCWLDKVFKQSISIIHLGDDIEYNDFIGDPWGWNPMIHRIFKDYCPGIKGLPSELDIAIWRRLSHRSTSIRLLSIMKKYGFDNIILPTETTDIDEIITRYNNCRYLILKAPWSSSGRGIMRTDDLEHKHIIPWSRGILRSQKSIIIEPIYSKVLDFASEWNIQNGQSEFKGWSIFKASGRGKYHGNLDMPQKLMIDMLKAHTEYDLDRLQEAQKISLDLLIAPYYSGPAGIDMMILTDRTIHPCVEINLRHTMGSVLLDIRI